MAITGTDKRTTKKQRKDPKQKNGWKPKRIGTNVGKEKKYLLIRLKPKGTRLIGSGGHIIDFRKKNLLHGCRNRATLGLIGWTKIYL